MGLIDAIFAKWKTPQQGVGNIPDVQTIQTPNSAQPPVSPQPTTAMERYAQLEAEMTRSHQALQTKPTSAADLDRGELKLQTGKNALDAIPAWYIADWADYSRGYYGWGYDWRFTPAGLQAARIKAGQLEAKVFQEKNAQIALSRGSNLTLHGNQ